MIITLIKNGETIKTKPTEPLGLTHSGATELAKNGVMLLHFFGKRPLFSVDNQGNYQLNIPQEKIPEPGLILTGKESFSRQSGQIINAIFSTNNIPEIDILSNSIASNNPQSFLAQNKAKHLIVIGSEACLNKWSHFVCQNSVKRSANSSLCIIQDGHIIYDSEKSDKHYMIDGVMDKFLIDGLNAGLLTRISDIFGYSPEQLKPFSKKIGQLPAVQSILSKIKKEKVQ